MDNIDVMYMDDDFNFDNNTKDEVKDIFDEVLEKKTSVVKEEPKKSEPEDIEKLDIIDIEEEPKSSNDMISETYSVIDKYKTMNNTLKSRTNELKLLKIKYETLENEYNALIKKYEKELKVNATNTREIKAIRKDLIESNKRVLMLKTLLELIINKYGMDSVAKVTKLNEEQINKYLK